MIKIIVAIGKNNELGRNGGLIWNLPNDLRFFKEQTMGCPVAMGSVTFNSLPKLLPGRKHIVLAYENEQFNKPVEQVEIINDKEEFITRCKQISEIQDLFIIGGASIYRMFLNIADELYITEVDAEASDADAYFPEIDVLKWNGSQIGENQDGDIKYKHVRYVKSNT